MILLTIHNKINKKKLAICFNSKCGATSIQHLENNLISNKDLEINRINCCKYNRNPQKIDNNEFPNLIKDHYVVFIIRDTYERLISTYLNVYTGTELGYFKGKLCRFLPEYKELLTNKSIDKYIEIINDVYNKYNINDSHVSRQLCNDHFNGLNIDKYIKLENLNNLNDLLNFFLNINNKISHVRHSCFQINKETYKDIQFNESSIKIIEKL